MSAVPQNPGRTLTSCSPRRGVSSGFGGVWLEVAAPGHLRLHRANGREPEGCRGAVRRAGVVQPGHVSSAHHRSHPGGEGPSVAGDCACVVLPGCCRAVVLGSSGSLCGC